MIKTILTNPNPVLRKTSQAVSNFEEKKVQETIQDLKETLRASKEGLGLAAPQIGVNLRIFALDVDDALSIFINPKITHFSSKTKLYDEGCLSVPGVWGKVKRSVKVVMKYYDEKGKKHKIKAKGLIAQAFQHEIDHLDGILFIDKMENI